MYLIRVLSFIGDVRFNVRGEHVPGCLGWGREGGWLPAGVGKGAWWLPARGIRASQGTFSSSKKYMCWLIPRKWWLHPRMTENCCETDKFSF